MILPDFRPKKSLGQNFLSNPRIIEKIVSLAGLKGDETVVEIGPGLGILTSALIKQAKRVIAIEKDEKLFEFLSRKFGKVKNLELIHADALKIPPPSPPYLLIANIPYSITSPLLDHFIRDNPSALPEKAVLLVQKEVAQKICSAPPRMNMLALHVQTFGKPKIMAIVSKNNFWPVPKVDSAVLKIEFATGTPQSAAAEPFDFKTYFELIHKAFAHKRKMLRSAFDDELLKKAGIDPTRRPETLSIDEWKKLAV